MVDVGYNGPVNDTDRYADRKFSKYQSCTFESCEELAERIV